MNKYIPILEWLPKYDIKNDLSYDIIAGITLSTLAIPQSLAYAMLAGIEPVYGLYTCFIPVLIYCIFGTSKHLATGVFALASIMIYESSLNIKETIPYYKNSEIINIVLILTFYTSIIQIFLSIFKISKLITYYLLPKNLVSPFITAVSFLISTSQISSFSGTDIPKYKGSLSMFNTWFYFILHINKVHLLTVFIAISSIVCLFWLKEVERKRAQKHLELDDDQADVARLPYIPIPEVVIVSVFWIITTWAFSLQDKGLKIVGEIPSGIPLFSIPNKLIPIDGYFEIFKTCLNLAIVVYVITISVSKTFSMKGNYEINDNKELFAIGISSFIGCFFSCYISCGSLTRTTIVFNSNGKSQISLFVSAVIIGFTLLFFTSLFKYLPEPVLASIILASVPSLMSDLWKLPKIYEEDKWDFSIFVIVFSLVIIFNINVGLPISILITLIIRLIKNYYQNNHIHLDDD